MKIGCLIYSYGEKFREIAACAVNSFKKFHPDVELVHITENNQHDFSATKFIKLYGQGIYKHMIALEVMKKYKFDKIIILGADTITCSRLDEFVDNNEDDILVTLSYPFHNVYPFVSPELQRFGAIPTPTILYKKDDKIIKEHHHFNSDVLCFNNAEALEQAVMCGIGHGHALDRRFQFQRETINDQRKRLDLEPICSDFYAENGGLNILCTISYDNQNQENLCTWAGLDYNFKVKCVDGPYSESSVVYNARAKGNIVAAANEKPWGRYTNQFYVKNNKLFTGDHKQIKIWHYCEAFGSIPDEQFADLMNNWIFDWFNEETKKFFKEQCDCEDFFEKEFSI